jgi:ClpP class serine protease
MEIPKVPNSNEILNEIQRTGSPFDVIRRSYLKELHELTGRNVIIYYSGWLQKPNVDPRYSSINDIDMNGFMTVVHELDRSKGLDLILHTPGGEQGATERLVNYLRSMYETDIRAFVPHLATSAGTMVACACKKIFMGKHSSLGPIDPQVNGMPAQSVLDSFDRAHDELKEDPTKIHVWHPILSKYNLTFRDQCQDAIDLTVKMVTKWLRTGMFSDMDEAESQEKIGTIVETLKDYGEFKSHNRHLSSEFCRDLGLKVSFFENNKLLQDAVLSVHHACMHTFASTRAIKMIENHEGTAFIQQINQQQRVVVNPQENQPQKSNQQRKKTKKR